jgi:RNase adapter protein RapZ
MRIVIVTGLSGAGKSTALRALEDCGFYCVDNVPLPLTAPLIDWLVADGKVQDLALAVDARQHAYLAGYGREIEGLRALGHDVDVLYLEASDEDLVRRYATTRRRHPLSRDDLTDGIRRDRQILAQLRRAADLVDTSHLNVHQLKGIIQDRYGHDGRLAVTFLSFGFQHGVPREANLMFDVRFLRNPYFDPVLTDRDGRDADVARYVLESSEAGALLGHLDALLSFVLPQFQKERKLYLTVAVGCTGGRHRSVAIVEELHHRFHGDWDVLVKHRDLDLRS